MALKGTGKKGSVGGKKAPDSRTTRYSDAQRKKSKATAKTAKPERKK